MDYDWPGNVRELRSLVERAFILTQDNIIKPEEIPFSIQNSPEKAISTLAEHKKQIILRAPVGTKTKPHVGSVLAGPHCTIK